MKAAALVFLMVLALLLGLGPLAGYSGYSLEADAFARAECPLPEAG